MQLVKRAAIQWGDLRLIVYVIQETWKTALKDYRDLETSVCLWLLRAWVRMPSVVIFDNQRLIQIVTYDM